MDDFIFVKAELDKRDYSDLPLIQDESGVPIGTMAKIKCDATLNPRYRTVRTLADYFRSKRKKRQTS